MLNASQFCCLRPADFYVEYLSDPESIWQRELKRQRAARGDENFTPATIPPLTTDDMALYFRAYLKRDEWGSLNLPKSHQSTPPHDGEHKTDPADEAGAEIATAKSRKHLLDTVGVSRRSKHITLDSDAAKRILEDDYTHSFWEQLKVCGQHIMMISVFWDELSLVGARLYRCFRRLV